MRVTRGEFISALFAPLVAPWAKFFPPPLQDWSPTLDALNLATLREMGGTSLADNFFQTSPLLDHIRDSAGKTWGGGISLQEPFQYEVFNIHAPSPGEVAWLG